MKARAVVVSCLAVVLAGCVPQTSLHPFYLEKDLVLEPSLNGSWVMQGEQAEADATEATEGEGEGDPFEGNIWTFQQTEGKAYSLRVAAETTSADFAAHLFRLGDALYLDLLPTEFEPGATCPVLEEGPPLVFFSHAFPVHGVMRVEIDGDQLLLGSLDDDWVKARLGPDNPVAHIEREGSLLLTAPPEELGKLLARAPADWSAFLGPFRLVRQSPPPPSNP